jgi:hypothetical protein
VLGQYLRGQLLVMLVLSLYYSVGLALFGLDLALPIGLFTGLAVFVPYVGFGLGLVLALLAGLLQLSSIKALVMVALVYGLGQVLESFVFTPRLVGERIGLHPLAVIFVLLAFGQLLGFVGILIALPAGALLLVAFGGCAAAILPAPCTWANAAPPDCVHAATRPGHRSALRAHVGQLLCREPTAQRGSICACRCRPGARRARPCPPIFGVKKSGKHAPVACGAWPL